MDNIKLLEVRKQVLIEKGVKDLGTVNKLIKEAMTAFSLEQFDEANDLVDKANEEIRSASREHLRLKTIAILGKNFFVRFWWQSLIVLLILVATIPWVVQKIHKKFLSLKIARLKLEQVKTKDSIKQLQKETFIDRKMTSEMYDKRAIKYEDRITEIKRIIPVLQSRLKNKRETWALVLFKKISWRGKRSKSGKK